MRAFSSHGELLLIHRGPQQKLILDQTAWYWYGACAVMRSQIYEVQSKRRYLLTCALNGGLMSACASAQIYHSLCCLHE